MTSQDVASFARRHQDSPYVFTKKGESYISLAGWMGLCPAAAGGWAAAAAWARLVSGDINQDARRQWNLPKENDRFPIVFQYPWNLLFFENWWPRNSVHSCSQLKEPQRPQSPSAWRLGAPPPHLQRPPGDWLRPSHWCYCCLVWSRESQVKRPAVITSCRSPWPWVWAHTVFYLWRGHDHVPTSEWSVSNLQDPMLVTCSAQGGSIFKRKALELVLLFILN